MLNASLADEGMKYEDSMPKPSICSHRYYNVQQDETVYSVTTRRMIDVAREFVQADIWVLAGVGCGKRQELVRLQQKLDDLFK